MGNEDQDDDEEDDEGESGKGWSVCCLGLLKRGKIKTKEGSQAARLRRRPPSKCSLAPPNSHSLQRNGRSEEQSVPDESRTLARLYVESL